MSCSDRTSAKAKSSRCKKDCCTTRNRRGSPPGNVRKDMRPSLEFKSVPHNTKEGPTGRHDTPRKAGDPRSTDQRRGCEKILRHAHARGARARKNALRHNSLRIKQQCHSVLTPLTSPVGFQRQLLWRRRVRQGLQVRDEVFGRCSLPVRGCHDGPAAQIGFLPRWKGEDHCSKSLTNSVG